MKFVLILLFSVLTVVGQTGKIEVGRRIDLKLPESIAQTGNIWLEVRIGALTKGTEIEIYTSEGKFLGVISPFGSGHFDKEASSGYIIPIPREAIGEGQLALRLLINLPDRSNRAPTKREIRGVRIKTSSN
jgi:hypothetical protein